MDKGRKNSGNLLAKRAGVSRMTFYQNYASKEDIFKDALTDILDNYYEETVQKNMTVYMVKFWNNYERRKLQAFAGVLYALYISWFQSGYRESTEEMAQLVGSLCCWD